jgi:hypothetical protein
VRRGTVAGVWLFAAAAGIACLVTMGGLALARRLPPPSGPLALPLAETLFTGVIFAPLLLAAVAAARLDGRNALALGQAAGRNAALGLTIGLGGMLAAVGDARLAGTLVPGADAGAGPAMLAWGALVILFQATAEEAFFRGWLQPSLAARWGAVPALLATAAAFALLHVAGGERAPLALLNLALGGLVFGLLALREGGLAGAVGAHFAWNASEQLVWGLDPNPGVGSFGAVADRDLLGSAAWGGTSQGLNNSVAMAAVLLAILVPLALTRRGGAARPVPMTA